MPITSSEAETIAQQIIGDATTAAEVMTRLTVIVSMVMRATVPTDKFNDALEMHMKLIATSPKNAPDSLQRARTDLQ